jgi:hypothetical protein
MAGSVTLEVVTVDKPADMNVIIGQAHFIKTVEDLHEALGGKPTAPLRAGVLEGFRSASSVRPTSPPGTACSAPSATSSEGTAPAPDLGPGD